MLISVIIPAYNSADTIVEALESVEAQTALGRNAGQRDHGTTGPRDHGTTGQRDNGTTGPRDQLTTSRQKDAKDAKESEKLPAVELEVIVVDDCSADGTVDVVRTWICEHPDTPILRYIIRVADANGGPAAARNAGIREANGEWIAFLDADDAWLPEKLEIQLGIMAQYPEAALICGGTTGLQDHPAIHPSLKSYGGQVNAGQAGTTGPPRDEPGAGRDNSLQKIAKNAKNCDMLRLENFAIRNPVATSTVLVKRSAVEEVGGFDERFRGPEDYDLWMRIAAEHRVIKIDTALSRYRGRPLSLSLDDRKFLPEVLRVLEKAFGPDGVLHEFGHLKNQAIAHQLYQASWMAFSRGDRLAALGHLVSSRRLAKVGPFLPRMVRYLVGTRE